MSTLNPLLPQAMEVVLGVLGLLFLLGLLVLISWLARRVAHGSSAPRVARGATLRITLTRIVGMVLGVTAAVAVANSTSLSLGRGPMLAPVAFGLAVLAAVAIGELLVRPSRDPVLRTASLTPRRVRDYLPIRLATQVGACLSAVLLVVAITTLTASADDLGRAGRSLSWACPPDLDGGWQGGSGGPYPGSFYSIPLLCALVLAVGVAYLAAKEVVRRPRGERAFDDEVLRRRATEAITAGLGIVVATPLIGVAFTAASALLRDRPCSPAWWAPTGWLFLTLALLGIVTLLWSISALLVPDQEPSHPTDGKS